MKKQPPPPTKETMTMQTEHLPFTGIIQRALSKRGAGSVNLHPVYKIPMYVVSACEQLLVALREKGNDSVTLDEVIRLEGTCTGADYQTKLALRCHRLAMAPPQ